MQTPTRPALMGKTHASLVQMLRLMGADSQPGESKESIINRILLFQRQEWKSDTRPKPEPVKPVTEDELHKTLKPYMLRGLKAKVKDGCWFVAIGDRRDSGSLSQPIEVIERTVKYLMKDK